MFGKEIISYRDEEWKDLELENLQERSKYKISNYGRIISYYYSEEGQLLKLGKVNGYHSFTLKNKDGKRLYMYVHRLVAMHFLKKDSEDEKFVIHLDNNRHNNYYRNLKWATQSEQFYHHQKINPELVEKFKPKGDRAWSKLTEVEVKIIKRKLQSGKTKRKVIARQFGISEMQLSRISTGENWGNVLPD